MKNLFIGLLIGFLSGISFDLSASNLIFESLIGDSVLTTEVIFYTPSIARVIKYPGKERPQKKSYSIVKAETQETGNFNFKVTKDSCGKLTFTSSDGKQLLREQEMEFSEPTSAFDAGKYKIRQSFCLDDDESIFGLGQLQDPKLNNRGKEIRLWTENTYTPFPYITSEKGYGLYWDNAGDGWFIDDEDGAMFQSEVAPMIDYFFIYEDGTQDGVIKGIRELTGEAPMFPLWAFGYWQSRERYKSSDELCSVLDRYRELKVPIDVIVQDWQYWGCDSNWNAMRFMNPHYINKMGDPQWMRYLPDDETETENYPDPRIKTPEEMVKYVHDNNARIMISIWASFGPWTPQFLELDSIGALLPFDTWPRNRGVRPYDPFNPEARDIYWKHLKELDDMGFDAWWTDSTEPDQWEQLGDSEFMTNDGTWRSVKNAFAIRTNGGIHESAMGEGKRDKRGVQMTRSGSFGLQRHGAFSWSGDVVSNWETFKKQIPSGLNYVICGIPYWNTDLGGFFGWDYNNDPKNPAMQELQTRWLQWGTFLPVMRNHCSSPMLNEIYEFGKEGDWAFDAQKKFIELRYRLLPYIYSVAGDVTHNSGTMMRPLVMDFPKDKQALQVSDQYMFGPSLLVKPVTDPMFTILDRERKGHILVDDINSAKGKVSIYLPDGYTWLDFWSGESNPGGQTVEKEISIYEMPIFVRAGSIIPFGPEVQYSSEKPWNELDVVIYPGDDGKFSLYEDEGDNYNYENGEYSQIEFLWNEEERTLTINDRKGGFNEMPTKRVFNIFLSSHPSMAQGLTKYRVEYEGKKTKVKL